ncbi:PEP-CTERM sorting domain-containing protein [Microcoleus sp. Pol7_A1]|uniref:PEP-CTERM sorting domain-containing protein n=1 Tax=Microcoleus sp. Pol7_A1 TaxID=2818893 RepID=UPI002FD3F796
MHFILDRAIENPDHAICDRLIQQTLDNSAQFLGVRSDAANISRLVYSSSEGDRALGINALSIAETVPEPSSMAATIVAGLGLLAVKIKRRSLLVK